MAGHLSVTHLQAAGAPSQCDGVGNGAGRCSLVEQVSARPQQRQHIIARDDVQLQPFWQTAGWWKRQCIPRAAARSVDILATWLRQQAAFVREPNHRHPISRRSSASSAPTCPSCHTQHLRWSCHMLRWTWRWCLQSISPTQLHVDESERPEACQSSLAAEMCQQP